MSRWQADTTLVFITLIWGSTFVVVKNALATVGPLTFVAWRFVAATVVLVFLFRGRLRALAWEEMRAGALIGVWLALGYILQTVGLQYTTTGKAGFITGLSVVIVPVLAAILLRQMPPAGAVVGVTLATIGLGFLSLDASLRVAPGDLWILGCAVAFALHIVSVSHFTARYDPIRLTVVQIATVAGLAVASAFLFEEPKIRLPAGTWSAILFTGAVATALVFSLQNSVQRFTTPTHTALIFSLEPVFAAFFGWWWAGETLGPKELVGCALILAGMVVAELGGLIRVFGPQTAEVEV